MGTMRWLGGRYAGPTLGVVAGVAVWTHTFHVSGGSVHLGPLYTVDQAHDHREPVRDELPRLAFTVDGVTSSMLSSGSLTFTHSGRTFTAWWQER